MIYANVDYKIYFYESNKGESLVSKYILKLKHKERLKVNKYIEFLRISRGILDEPYSKHIKGKIRELRVDFGKNRHRIFYFTFVDKKIIMLHAFLKKTQKAPPEEIQKAENNYYNFINHEKHA